MENSVERRSDLNSDAFLVIDYSGILTTQPIIHKSYILTANR